MILKFPEEEAKLLTFYEFRYPTGRYLLSIPAGLIDPADCETEDPILTAARREIKEETGITIKDTDIFYTVNPTAFSSPGMTDESNVLVGSDVFYFGSMGKIEEYLQFWYNHTKNYFKKSAVKKGLRHVL